MGAQNGDESLNQGISRYEMSFNQTSRGIEDGTETPKSTNYECGLKTTKQATNKTQNYESVAFIFPQK